MLGKMGRKLMDLCEKVKKTGRDDPRRIVHAMKVGLALTLVSMLYYFRPLYKGFGQSALWAVLTVVVVFEYTVGATLSKSLNRAFATLVAGMLGVGAEYLADLFGEKGEPIVLGFMVFLLATTLTFTRFIPQIKQRYDYGVMIFILTFSLVTVSGYRVDEIIELAHQRLSTILIGVAACIIISIFLCPVWAGEDLHNLIAGNIHKLADFLEGLSSKNCAVDGKDDETYMQVYKSVLNTKATEESLANFAWWEPSHGGFRFSHPWKQYSKIGVLSRQCAYQIEALTSCIKSKPQGESEIPGKIQEACTKMSSEAGKALKEMSLAIKTMTNPSTTIETHIENARLAVDDLKIILETSTLDKANAMEILQVLSFASILMEIIKCVENIREAVTELSVSASFKMTSPAPEPEKSRIFHLGVVKPVNKPDSDEVVITIVPDDLKEDENSRQLK